MPWFSQDELNVAFDVLIKVGVSVVLGGLIGLERELHGRPAGIRTHMLIAMGVTLFTEVSRAFAPSDVARIAAQIVTGIGFLGAGTILRTGGEVRGLTSAASIWAVAAIAMAVSTGGGFILVAIAATGLGLVTLRVVQTIEERIAPNLKSHELVAKLDSRDHLVDLLEALQRKSGRVFGVRVLNHHLPVEVEIDLHGASDELMGVASSCPGVLAATWKR